MNMGSSDAQPRLKYDNMVVSPQGISECQYKKVVIFVPKSDIESITVKFGRSAHRPILSLFIGFNLGLAGIVGLFEFLLAPAGFRYESGLVALGLIGGSVIFDTLKQRFFIEIHRRNGAMRVVLSKQAQKSDLQDFCARVGAIYKYDITDAT